MFNHFRSNIIFFKIFFFKGAKVEKLCLVIKKLHYRSCVHQHLQAIAFLLGGCSLVITLNSLSCHCHIIDTDDDGGAEKQRDSVIWI